MKSWVEVSLNTPAQLSLPLYLPDDETFASFWPGDNSSLLAALQNVLRQEHSGYIYLGRVKALAVVICCMQPVRNCPRAAMR